MGDLHYIDDENVEKIVVNQSDVDDTPVDGVTIAPISSNWAHGHENDDDVHDATQVNVSELGTATYDDVQDFINQFGSRTNITGMVITDNYDGSLAVSGGTGWCKVTDDINAEGKFFNFTGANVSSGSLTDLSVNYIYLDYNAGGAGVPGLVAETAGAHFYKYDHIVLGCVFMHGNHGHIINSGWAGLDAAHRTKMRFFEEFAGTRTSGLVTTATGTRQLVVTKGRIWVGLTPITSLEFDTSAVTQGTADDTASYRLIDSGASFTLNDVDKRLKNTSDTTYTDVVDFISSTELRVKDNIFVSGETYDLYDAWDCWYTSDSGSTWTQVEGCTQIDSANYNDVTSGLTALSAASHYGVYWLYIDQEGDHLHMVYGQASEIQALAEIEAVPSYLPPIARDFGILIAKILVQKDQDTLIINYPWTTAFAPSAAADHGNLAGLTDAADHAWALIIDGTRAMTGDLDLGANKVIANNAAGDAYASLDSGDNAVDGNKGLAFYSQTDEDIELINLTNTGGNPKPRFFWDEGATAWSFNWNLVCGTFKPLGKILMADGINIELGNSSDWQMRYHTSDADAKILLINSKPSNDAGNNAAIVVLATEVAAQDFGFFDSHADDGFPRYAVVDPDYDSFVTFGFEGDDDPQIKVGGAASGFTIATDLTVDNLITSGSVDGIDVSAHDVATTGVHGVGGDTVCSEGTALAFAIAL